MKSNSVEQLIEIARNIESNNTAVIVMLSIIVAILTVWMVVYLSFKLKD